MPLQNRVTPYGLPERHPARTCLLTGNRGTIHDERREIVRHHVARRWIACALKFKDHHREPMPPGRWTALFFLDEAVAFAAGHRPCKYCRREDHARFMAAWNAGVGPARLVDDVDRPLHAERYARGKRLHGPAPMTCPTARSSSATTRRACCWGSARCRSRQGATKLLSHGRAATSC